DLVTGVQTCALPICPTHQEAALHGEAVARRAPVTHAASDSLGNSPTLSTVAPNTKRIQRYSASLELRLRDAAAVSDASKRAIAIDRKSTRLNSSHQI